MGGMTYHQWREHHGKYCWYHEDGTARVTLPLDYNWTAIYEQVTKDADIFFHHWEIPEDVSYFTSQFYAAVPQNWLKYKTAFEMFTGTLDGTTIDPAMFEAGYTRTTEATRTEDNTYTDTDSLTSNSQSSSNGNSTQAPHTDSSNSAARAIQYQQGVQALDFGNKNIGELGNKYASALTDNVSNSSTDFGEQNVTAETTDTTSDSSTRNRTNTDDKTETFNERVHETRINYYDNLAFLRERMDRLKDFVSFHSYFMPVFYDVVSMRGNW